MYHFFAKLSRMRYIMRWGLMRNVRSENLCEHSWETAVLAHALATLRNRRFGGHVDAQRAAVLALYHDAPEILTGDLPTPVKYASGAIHAAYEKVEREAQRNLLGLLPADLREDYAPLLRQDDPADGELLQLVKAADKLSALIKCVNERSMGNSEFSRAEESTRAALAEMKLPEVNLFVREFLPSYSLTLDEQI
ncbi:MULTISPECIES: 5'-deoxynucleotidase [Caproicibacterium]|jgi:5'-deoxynucleotidase|uniref:5'-deoxynucleotidase n=1 Tax=Caproicibacterium lactatifermentans TaxID=2666138 RepID=A0A859DNF2_9FIRM|nr:5'-deoxynucleotidase [Caproicibacterium lactatifermentans]ARP49442.1 5'-deoxynucleotidase [Ruminococcaceae bacterium CPB6]MDD4806936.1 5'-deoxynucleotidase [Oscillospiraceae bacterium]QKN23034.1 5'-deoxynucleotidase [Caproicibacterium lactatifermentans]QKO30360.1 5'-deoxynucleotidase [Caproicibacterium lactatifermentans]